MASTDNNTQYPANQIMITGNGGTVTASGSMVAVPSTNQIGVGTTAPLGPFDVNVSASFRQGFTTQNVAVFSSLISNGTATFGNVNTLGTAQTNVLIANIYGRFGQNIQVLGSNVSINSTTGAFVNAGGEGIGGNLNVGGTVSTFTGAVGIGTANGVGIATTPNSANLWVYGNVVLANTATTTSGVIFTDGTKQTTAAQSTPSYGLPGTVQFAGTGNTFLGDSTNFFWDNSNKRLGIGTGSPAYLFSIYGTDYVLFNNRPGNAARQEIVVGNVTGFGSVLGYDPSIATAIGYLRLGTSAATSPALAWSYTSSNYRVGVNAITQPQNAMDINGAVAIGNSYSGFAVMTNTNGASIQGQVGIGTFTPGAQLDVTRTNTSQNANYHLQFQNGSATGQTNITYLFNGTQKAYNRVDYLGNMVWNSGTNTFYFNNEAIGGGTAGTANFVNSATFMTTSNAAVTFPGAVSTVSVTANTMVVTGGYSDSALKVQTANGYGGAGYAGIQTWTNNITGSTNPNKYWRVNSIGGIEIINNAYNAVLFTFTDTGAFSATNEITAYSSDGRLKENIELITDPIHKIQSLRGVTFDWKPTVRDLGFEPTRMHDVGVIAQEVAAVLPEAVRPAPFDVDVHSSIGSKSGENYLTVQYEKLTALLIEAVKAQQAQIEKLEARITTLELDP